MDWDLLLQNADLRISREEVRLALLRERGGDCVGEADACIGPGLVFKATLLIKNVLMRILMTRGGGRPGQGDRPLVLKRLRVDPWAWRTSCFVEA